MGFLDAIEAMGTWQVTGSFDVLLGWQYQRYFANRIDLSELRLDLAGPVVGVQVRF